jgi:hypothetical protein
MSRATFSGPMDGFLFVLAIEANQQISYARSRSALAASDSKPD